MANEANEDKTVSCVRVDYASGERVYLQIVRIIRDMIISGELPVGTQIPSGAQMKRQWGVNRLTGLRRGEVAVRQPAGSTSFPLVVTVP